MKEFPTFTTVQHDLCVFWHKGEAAVACWQLQALCPSKGENCYASADSKGVSLSKFLSRPGLATVVPADALPEQLITPARGTRPHALVCQPEWAETLRRMGSHWDVEPARAALLTACRHLNKAPISAGLDTAPFEPNTPQRSPFYTGPFKPFECLVNEGYVRVFAADDQPAFACWQLQRVLPAKGPSGFGAKGKRGAPLVHALPFNLVDRFWRGEVPDDVFPSEHAKVVAVIRAERWAEALSLLSRSWDIDPGIGLALSALSRLTKDGRLVQEPRLRITQPSEAPPTDCDNVTGSPLEHAARAHLRAVADLLEAERSYNNAANNCEHLNKQLKSTRVQLDEETRSLKEADARLKEALAASKRTLRGVKEAA